MSQHVVPVHDFVEADFSIEQQRKDKDRVCAICAGGLAYRRHREPAIAEAMRRINTLLQPAWLCSGEENHAWSPRISKGTFRGYRYSLCGNAQHSKTLCVYKKAGRCARCVEIVKYGNKEGWKRAKIRLSEAQQLVAQGWYDPEDMEVLNFSPCEKITAISAVPLETGIDENRAFVDVVLIETAAKTPCECGRCAKVIQTIATARTHKIQGWEYHERGKIVQAATASLSKYDLSQHLSKA